LFIGAPPAVNDAGCVFYLDWQYYFLILTAPIAAATAPAHGRKNRPSPSSNRIIFLLSTRHFDF
jgi:hypothetical protein